MAVAPIHGKLARVLMDERDFSDFLREINVSAEVETSDVTTFGDGDKSYLPGLRSATFSFDGLFAASTATADDIANELDNAFGGSTKRVMTVDLDRSTGGRAFLMQADPTSYDISVPVDDIVSISVDAEASGGYRGGRMLRPLAAATSTGSNSSVNLAGSTSAGGSTGGGTAHLHVTAASTLTTLTVRVQHSTSGSTWATLLTFSNATAETFQRSTVAGTIKEKLRATSVTLSGGAAKSVSYAVAFAREKGKS